MRRLRRAYQRNAKKRNKNKFKQKAIVAGTTAALTLGTVGLHKALAYTPDPHELPVSQDMDADLLANTEEFAIGYRVFNGDQNRNEIPDGVELAKRCASIINQLPVWEYSDPVPTETFKVEHYFWGLETCDICDEIMNMGGVEIVNPKLGLSYPQGDPFYNFLPFMSVHYMEHGSFSFSGSTNSGRAEIARLLRVLELQYPYDPNEHQLPVDGNDLDGDLLTDSEELKAGFDLYDSDQNKNLSPDGIELAKRCGADINELPWQEDALPGETYKWCGWQYGLETCDICGATVNMGPAGIVNPQLGLSIDCPLIAMHYMEHGSFSYAGDVHGKGRIDIPLLLKVLEMPRQCGDLGTLYLPADLNKDCKVDFADFGKFADKWLGSTEPGQD